LRLFTEIPACVQDILQATIVCADRHSAPDSGALESL
jgi:hypothetical protein